MSWSAPVRFRPFAADLAVSRTCLRYARPLSVITWLADEQIMLAATTAFWAATRFSSARSVRREADQMLCSVLIAGAVPHLFKHLVARERPNRTLVRRADRRVPSLGNAWDSFPSSDAMHLSAIATSAQRLVSRRWRPVLTGGLATLAASRIMLLAHYPSDVIAGWGIGALINRAVGRALRRVERSRSSRLRATPPLQPY
jgi:undecaprenyl-diphosphatase